MPDTIKNIIKSFTEKGSALRPTKSSKKSTTNVPDPASEKVKEKKYSMYGGSGSVKKVKYTDKYGNKHKFKESTKTYRNPLNDEQVTVTKTQNDGKRNKEVRRDRASEPMLEPMKEAVKKQESSEMMPGGTPAAAPQKGPMVPYEKTEKTDSGEAENKKREELMKRIKESKGNSSQYKEAIGRIFSRRKSEE
jgi:hypothetical protein